MTTEKRSHYREETNGNGADALPCGSLIGARWYCVQSKPRDELVAEIQLRQQGFEAYLPQQMEAIPGKDARIRPLFPGYLFVRFDRDRDQWRPICHTRGVYRLFSASPERPIPVPRGVVEAIRAKAAPNGVIYPLEPERTIPPGTKLRITGGAFEFHTGVCQWTGQDRVGLLLQILGGSRVVEVPRSLVEAA